ncbi:MAG: tetratricopeptide repeat protein [SAR324 cluster bacterium]|nr:tetratricopeptide repeat protein [SAR324 cluster bacterium]
MRKDRIARPRLPAVLLALLLLSLCAREPLQAQSKLPFSLAEVRQIQKIRELRQPGQANSLAKAAQAYTKQFPQGRYADEVLLALGEAHDKLGHPAAALDAYDRLITGHPDSPFREQALAASILLLEKTGKREQARGLSGELLKRYPRSLYRGRTLLWQARGKFNAGAFAEAITLLGQVEAEGLAAAEAAEYYRIYGWSYWRTEQRSKAWPMFSKYLKREGAAEHKAPVLMIMAGALEKSGAHAQALSYYDQLVEHYPHPEHLSEALFRGAALYEGSVLAAAPPKTRPALREKAIQRYSTYLDSGDKNHLESALRSKGRLLIKSGRNEQALLDYERLAALNKTRIPDLEILHERVELLGELGRHQEAIALLSSAIKNTALSQQARTAMVVERAGLYYEREACDEVVQSLEPLPVFANAEHRKKALFLRGFCHFRMGSWERASWDLEGLVNDPEYVALVWQALIEAYQRSGQNSRLVNLGERLLATKQVEPAESMLTLLAGTYEKLGQPGMMLSTIRRLEKLNPQAVRGAEIQFRLGRAEQAMDHADQAEAHFLAALAAPEDDKEPPPEYLDALEQLQGIFINRGRFEVLEALNRRAEKHLRSEAPRRRLATLQALAYLEWSRAELSAGRSGSAGGKIERAWAVMPRDAGKERREVLEALLAHYARSGAQEKARALYERERSVTKDSAGQAQLAEIFAAFYLGWAESSEEKDAPAQVIRRYEQALALLPSGQWQSRYRTATKLDRLYRKTGNFKARDKLFAGIGAAVPKPALRDQLRIYRSRIYRDWARKEAGRERYGEAMRLLAQGEKLLKETEWKPRYDLLAVQGEVLLAKRNYSELLIRYEKFLPAIATPKLRAQVTHFIGQVYLTWAQAAKKSGNRKSTRIRAYRALDTLPPSDWKRRLTAAKLLTQVLEQEDKATQAMEIYAALIPQLPEGKVRRQYALFLGRKLSADLKNGRRATPWLLQSDQGGNDPLSLEAGYLLAGIEAGNKQRPAAIARLKNLTARGLQKSRWLVPIYSRLAVLYHEQKQLKLALKNYRIVANVKSVELRKLYPKSIRLAKQQVRAIRNYLKFRGGGAGEKLAVPKVRG